MVTVILNADDFGYSRGTNYAILDTFYQGKVTSTTMMMNMSGTQHAIELAKKHPHLGVGIHLVLSCGKPLSDPTEIPSIVRSDGHFYKNPSDLLDKNVQLEEVEKEWRKQIDRFYEAGLVPTHLDSHHHVHTHPLLYPVIEKLSSDYGLPVRRFENMGAIQPFSDAFCGDFYGKDVIGHSLLNQIIEKYAHVDTLEIMVHPAYIDEDIVKGSSYVLERAKETEIILSWDIPKGVHIYHK